MTTNIQHIKKKSNAKIKNVNTYITIIFITLKKDLNAFDGCLLKIIEK